MQDTEAAQPPLETNSTYHEIDPEARSLERYADFKCSASDKLTEHNKYTIDLAPKVFFVFDSCDQSQVCDVIADIYWVCFLPVKQFLNLWSWDIGMQ